MYFKPSQNVQQKFTKVHLLFFPIFPIKDSYLRQEKQKQNDESYSITVKRVNVLKPRLFADSSKLLGFYWQNIVFLKKIQVTGVKKNLV